MISYKQRGLLVALSAFWLFLKLFSRLRRKWRLHAAIQARMDEQKANFGRTRKFYEEQPVERSKQILALSYPELKEQLQSGEVSSVEALRAYQRKAMEVTAETNCVCLFVEEAISMAQQLDAKARDRSYQKPPLFGLPVSVKECVAIKGMDSTLGYVQDLGKPSADHSAVVKTLLHLGAVPFVHTNNPLSLLTWGCTNAVYGRTTHPKDKSRIPGGSSGGESALIAAGGSLLGIGSDIGGSIRIPASFCGLAGFKPSVQRMSHVNSPGGVPGRCKIIATEGPMARSIDICIDFLRLTWSDPFLFQLDPYVPPIYWDEALFSATTPLTIGWYTHDGYFKPAPAYVRAVEEAVRLLKKRGHNLVAFKVPKPDSIFPLLLGSVSADGGHFLADKMSRDIVPGDVDYGFLGRSVPPRVQKWLKPLIPWYRLRQLLGSMPSNMQEMRRVNADIDTYRRHFLEQIQKQSIDVLICPPMILYPPPPEVPVSIPPATGYTSLYNVLDYPAGVVPITEVTSDDDVRLHKYPSNDPYDRLLINVCKDMIGFPIGVQVAALPYREEAALRVLKELQDTVDNRG